MKISLSLTAAIAVLSLSGLLVQGTVAHAQVDPSAAPKHAKRGAAGQRRNPIAAAFSSVSPTADEQTKFDALSATMRADVTAANADPSTARARSREIATKFTADAAAILTPEQGVKFKQAVVVLPIMTSLEHEVMPTADEKTKIEPILADFATKADGVKGKARRSMADEAKAKIRVLLTTEQQVKLDAMRGFGPAPRAEGGAPPAALAPPAAPEAPAKP